jgi:Spy/CpxP family protein refolding chaperone
MKIAILAALLAALSLPLATSAQVVQQPPIQGQGQQRGGGASVYNHWMKRLNGLNLSAQQQQQIQSTLGQYAQQHPAGSQRDPQGAHALRAQIFSILSPDQQAQLHAQMKAMRAQRAQRRSMEQQQQPQGPPVQQQPQPPLSR